MRRARLRFTGALGDFLPPQRREAAFDVEFELPVGLRDLVQSVGVPHVEVRTVVVDGREATWSRRVDDGARVTVYPRYPLVDPPPDPRFLLDVHLGRLAGYLRLAGLDAAHHRDLDDPELVERSTAEGCILLTRDRRLLMHAALERGSYVREVQPLRQAVEIVDRFALARQLRPFTRCMVCNGVLVDVDAGDVSGRLPPAVAERDDVVRTCPGCSRLYWEGSHQPRLRSLVARMQGGGP